MNGDGTYTLSGLLRGRRGTEWAVGTHEAGDRFVLLSSDAFRRIFLEPNGHVGAQRKYRALSVGEVFDTAYETTFTNTAAGLKPYSPCQISGSRDGSNNLTISWIRRTRVGGNWEDGHDVPLGEETEAYEVEIFQGNVKKRTLQSTIQNVVYSATNQSTDGFTPGDPITLKAYQMSTRVGRGFARQATV